jgi:hypothetical protein
MLERLSLNTSDLRLKRRSNNGPRPPIKKQSLNPSRPQVNESIPEKILADLKIEKDSPTILPRFEGSVL